MSYQPHTNGRPPRDVEAEPTSTFSVRLTDDERAKLDSIAKARREPRGSLARDALRAAGLI